MTQATPGHKDLTQERADKIQEIRDISEKIKRLINEVNDLDCPDPRWSAIAQRLLGGKTLWH